MDQNDVQKMQQMKQLEEMKRQLLSAMLTKDAFERLARVRLVNPQLASSAEMHIIQAAQSNKLAGRITDERIKDILRSLSGGGNETRIRRI